jgi:hypothetical protein
MLMDIESLGVPFASQACHREGSSPFRTLLCAQANVDMEVFVVERV